MEPDKSLEAWRVGLGQRVDELERKLTENTEATKRVEANTKEMVDIFVSWQGAMKVLEFLGKLAKPLAAIGAALGVWFAWKSQK